jgi:hypothetical protein
MGRNAAEFDVELDAVFQDSKVGQTIALRGLPFRPQPIWNRPADAST